jgi:uncharacterized protein (DUF934 family)
MPLIKLGVHDKLGGHDKNFAVVADPFITLTDDQPLPPEGGAIVSLNRFRKDRDALLARNAPIGVKLTADESPEQLGDDVHRLSVVMIQFPKFRDGRGFSWARMLRTRLNFAGEVRAGGDFLYDQIAYLLRTGFDAFDSNFTLEDFARARSEMSFAYQPSADGKKTIRDLRSGK